MLGYFKPTLTSGFEVMCRQAAFLARASADALIKAVSHMSRYAGPRAPTDISDPTLNELKINPSIVKDR